MRERQSKATIGRGLDELNTNNWKYGITTGMKGHNIATWLTVDHDHDFELTPDIAHMVPTSLPRPVTGKMSP